MPLLDVIVVVALVGFVCYLLVRYVPMLAPFKDVIVVVVVIALVLWVVSLLGVHLPIVGHHR